MCYTPRISVLLYDTKGFFLAYTRLEVEILVNISKRFNSTKRVVRCKMQAAQLLVIPKEGPIPGKQLQSLYAVFLFLCHTPSISTDYTTFRFCLVPLPPIFHFLKLGSRRRSKLGWIAFQLIFRVLFHATQHLPGSFRVKCHPGAGTQYKNTHGIRQSRRPRRGSRFLFWW